MSRCAGPSSAGTQSRLSGGHHPASRTWSSRLEPRRDYENYTSLACEGRGRPDVVLTVANTGPRACVGAGRCRDDGAGDAETVRDNRTCGTCAAVGEHGRAVEPDRRGHGGGVGRGVFQSEGFIYMAYVSAAVYDAVVAIEGGFEPYGAVLTVPDGASVDAAVIEAAYQTLVNYFPSQAGTLDLLRADALALVAEEPAKRHGQSVGRAAAKNIIKLRSDDGRMTPYGVTSSFPTLPPGPGVWRLTPPLFLAPQVPWVGNVDPFVLRSLDQFLPVPARPAAVA